MIRVVSILAVLSLPLIGATAVNADVQLPFRVAAGQSELLLKLSPDESRTQLSSVEIVEKKSGKTIDKLDVGKLGFSENWYSAKRPSSVFQDLNFDGYTDLLLKEWVSPAGNEGSRVWLFDPKESKFKFHKDLSGLPNIFASVKERLILSGWKGSGGSMTNQKHRWSGKNLELYEESSQTEDRKFRAGPAKECGKKTTTWMLDSRKKLIKGKMVTINHRHFFRCG